MIPCVGCRYLTGNSCDALDRFVRIEDTLTGTAYYHNEGVLKRSFLNNKAKDLRADEEFCGEGARWYQPGLRWRFWLWITGRGFVPEARP